MPLCSPSDVAYVLGDQCCGQSLRIDAESEDASVDAAIEQADSIVNQLLLSRYQESQITSSVVWVKWCAATVAAVLLSRQRCNQVPQGLQAQYDEYMTSLRAIQQRQPGASVPGVPEASSGVSVVTLIHSQYRHPWGRDNPVIVDRKTDGTT